MTIKNNLPTLLAGKPLRPQRQPERNLRVPSPFLFPARIFDSKCRKDFVEGAPAVRPLLSPADSGKAVNGRITELILRPRAARISHKEQWAEVLHEFGGQKLKGSRGHSPFSLFLSF